MPHFGMQDNGALVAALGIQLQLGGSLLCLGLGLFLRQGIGQRSWMSWWTWSFGAVAIAVTALLFRYNLVPLVPLASLQAGETQLAGVYYAIYAGAKLLFLFCLAAGTWLFVTRQPVPKVGLGGAAALIAGVAILFALKPTDLNPLMAWQAGYAVPVFLACAWLLYRMPSERRTRGSRVLALICLLHAGLWILYTPAFLGAPPDSSGAGRGFLGWLSAHNSYVDVMFEFLLVFGMILAVLDDVYHEAEAARLARLSELADSEARLSQIIRAASDGIVLLDAEHRIMHTNPAALEILGRTEEEVHARPFDQFVSGSGLEEFWARAAATSGEHPSPVRPPATPPGGYEIQGLRGDGQEFPLEISFRAIGRAEPEGYVLILRDRTHRVRLEEERDRMQSQLAQAARLETIGRMVSGVAHELNNPLTAILAFAQDLQGQSKSITDTEALTTIVQQAQRCRAIVQDLLTFARTKREDRQSLQPRELIERVLPDFERQGAEQGVRLRVDLRSDMPSLHANPSAMEQVLTNLLSNAFHAAGKGGAVTLTGRVDGDRIALIVEDDGPGIPPEILPRLFEPFFTTKEPGQGTGLGLSVSHGIIEQHGGTLVAENRSGPGEHGARFIVLLPYLDRRAVRRAPASPAGSAAPSAAAALSAQQLPRRVLVIDDETPIRIAVRRFLERRGWVVEEAGNGREALDLLGLEGGGVPRWERYDAISTDLRMPRVSGIEIHDRLAAVGAGALRKLVMISGDTASAEVVEFMGRIRQPVIQKPFDMRALVDLLDQTAPQTSLLTPQSVSGA